MNIVFRVDSSTEVGSGHLMRCLTLAKRLKKRKYHQVVFISRELDGNMNFLIKQHGYKLFSLPKSESGHVLNGYESWLTVKQKVDAEQTTGILKNLCIF